MSHCAISVTRVVARTVVILAVVLAGAVPEALAQTGTISGTVTGSGMPLPNTEVHFYNLAGSGDGVAAIATTNGVGVYSVNLPPGAYAFITQNTLGYINEVYDNIQCSAVCDLSGMVPTLVTNGSNLVANFDLEPGGRIAGRITDFATGLGIAGVKVYFVPPSGEVAFTTATTDANGDYLSNGGTATGTVFAATFNALGYQNEVWNDVKCGDCDWTAVGTPMNVTIGVTTGGFDFALDMGGSISGTVRDVNLAPIPNVEITVYDSAGDAVAVGVTDASGNYRTGGVVTGTYYVGTNQDVGYVDEVYNNIPCINGNCDPRVGMPLSVTLGETVSGIDFVLEVGGNITGTITNAVTGLPINDNIFVQFMDAAGNFVGGAHTDDTMGQFTAQGVAAGTYYAIAGYPGFFNQMYNNLTCSTNCNTLLSTPIHVTTGATTANINFALQPTTAVGTISGTVRDIGTAGSPVISTLNVQLLSATGAVIANMNTNASGVYTFSNLAVASYYVRANPGNQPFIGMLHGSPSDVVCLNCNVLTTAGAALVPVTAGATTTIDFSLTAGGRISGVVTNEVGGAAISGIQVQVFSSAGVNLGTVSTNASGAYTTRGLPAGNYFLRTTDPVGSFVGELYDSLFCPGPGCNVITGTPVAVAGTTVVGGRNFALAPAGRIQGSVSNAATGAPISFGVNVQIFTDAGTFLGNALPNASGDYTSFGLPAGRYYLRTSNSLGFIDELFDNLPCVGVCSVTAGTPVDVTVGASTTGRSFALSPGGNISGTVRDAGTNALLPQARVGAYLADGTLARGAATNANGEYVIAGLAPGTYYLRTAVVGILYLDELYNELPCAPTCTLTDGEPVVIVSGVTQGGRNFTLTPGGGALSGTVRDAATSSLMAGVTVQVHLADGTMVKNVATNSLGAFALSVPAGTYYARTLVSTAGAYLDELFDELPCTPTCNVAGGAPIAVVDGATTEDIEFTLAPNLVRNGRFDSGTSNWAQFATPDMSNMVSQVTNGVFEYYRVGSSATQAVVFQETGVALPANAPVIARFSIGNSSSVRKRISVLVLDSNFSDLAVCTFWIPANTPLAPYRMITHTTQAWANASIYFYAASTGSNGGFYQLDQVSVERAPAESAAETTCVDPLAPAPPGGPNGPELLVNGNFNTGTLAPWGTFGQINSQIVGGVFQFTKLAGTPAGVVLQPTNVAVPAGTILTATFQLGNSSAQRQRVTVIVHDSSFGDLAACTFYVTAGQPLSDYTFRTFATQAWANATLSVYPATTNGQQWALLDNVTLRTTPSTAILGTECVEPGGTLAPSGSTSGIAQASGFTLSGARAAQDGARREPHILQRDAAIDLTASTGATFALRAWLPRSAAWGEVQLRGDDGEWRTVQVIRGSDDWAQLVIDLTEYLGQVVDVRIVVYPE